MQGAANSRVLDRVGLLFWAALLVWVALVVAVQYVFALSGVALVLLVLATGVVTAVGVVPAVRSAYGEMGLQPNRRLTRRQRRVPLRTVLRRRQ